MDFMGKEYSKAMGKYVADLAVLGYKALEYAYNRRGFSHKSYNLQDSYASGVYVDGKLIDTSVRFYRPEMADKAVKYEGNWMKGRDAAWDYLKHPKVDVGRGITLLCIAAMPYAANLENGTHRGGYHIQVISAAYDYLEREWANLNKNKPKEFQLIRRRVITGGDSYS